MTHIRRHIRTLIRTHMTHIRRHIRTLIRTHTKGGAGGEAEGAGGAQRAAA